MNKLFKFLISLGLLASILLVSAYILKQETEPWTAEQLLEPSALASAINNKQANQPQIFCVGPGAIIPHSLDLGPAKEKENLNKLRTELNKLPRDAYLVIYCGCCPFERCPNVRPAFTLINEMKFTHAKLLNLPHNLKTDWIDKGYPVSK